MGRGLRNQSLWGQLLCLSSAVLPSSRLCCLRGPAHPHASSFTYHSGFSGRITSEETPTLIVCLLSYLLHLSFFLTLVDNSLEQIMQWKVLRKLKSVLRNQNSILSLAQSQSGLRTRDFSIRSRGKPGRKESEEGIAERRSKG